MVKPELGKRDRLLFLRKRRKRSIFDNTPWVCYSIKTKDEREKSNGLKETLNSSIEEMK